MSAVERVRAIALLLPEVVERPTNEGADFLVDGKVFAQVVESSAPAVRVREAAGDVVVTLGDDADWTLVEDRVARSWELTAPRRLLEAGGR
ncbi:MmcQ/YjbR family DNA-binding protein [Sphingomonas sp. LR60]|uniref:MmcQ/YjbR family DNA-binding protein n=1 Tax=Sphingomonas sp. LR60 TaxID=3050233 RepID=UPI002FE3AB44